MGRQKLRTPLCDMLNIEYPIISAGMGPTLIGEPNGAPVELVVAVSEAGGLGVLGGAGFTLDELRAAIREIKSLTDKPYGVDLLLPKNLPGSGMAGGGELNLAQVIGMFPEKHLAWFRSIEQEMGFPPLDDVRVPTDTATMNPRAAVAICIEERVPLFAAGLGDPGFMVAEAHQAGMKVLGLVGNARNAARIARSGVDLVAAQGHEGGGHTGRVGAMALLPQAIDAAHPVPVLAAGGIGDGRGLAAALAMGCIGVWVGTRFLATYEGGAMDLCKQKIVESDDEGTRVSRLFTGKTSRANVTGFHELWDASGLDPLPFPFQVLLASALLEGFRRSGHEEYISGFAGQVSGLIHDIKPAARVVEEMVEQAADILTVKLPEMVSVG